MISLVPFLALLTAASPMTKKSGSPLLNSTYVTPSFQQTRQIINQDAVASIDALLASSSYPPGWVGQNGFTTVANWDYQRKTKTYEREFSANESYYSDHPGGCFLYWHSPLADCFNDDSGWAGMASLEGYMAYANKTYLDWAVSVHNYVSNHGFINDTVLQNGYLKGVHYANNTLQKTCDDKSMYGGVYFQNGWPYPDAETGAAKGAANTHIDSGSTATYALLAAKLCSVTGDMSYCDRSADALHFMDRFMVGPSGLIDGWIDGQTCEQWTDVVSTTTTGNYFGAYALVGNLTKNATATSIARKSALLSLTTDLWNSNKGVLVGHTMPGQTEVAGLKSVLVRNMALIYPLMDAEMQAALLQYINIQYWSLVNFDSDDASRPVNYGVSWNGPKYNGTNGKAQLQAVDVLNAIALNPDSAFPSTATSGKPVITA